MRHNTERSARNVNSKTMSTGSQGAPSSAHPTHIGTHRRIGLMPESTDEFYRIQKLPPYVFAVINEMRARARAAQQDVIDLGMGNPDGATPRVVVSKLVEAARNARNHRYSASRGIPKLREEITRHYQANYDVDLDPDKEAIVTIGAKDALAHLLFAVIGPGDAVVSPNPAYPIHQYGVIMAEGQACLLPMPSPQEFLNRLEDLYQKSSRHPKLILISFPRLAARCLPRCAGQAGFAPAGHTPRIPESGILMEHF